MATPAQAPAQAPAQQAQVGAAKRDTSKSTTEGEWEMRDGKWYRRDYYGLDKKDEVKKEVQVQPAKCLVCPTHIERITILTREREELKNLLTERDRIIIELRARLEKWDELQRVLAERDRLIIDLRARLEKWESESKTWIIDRRTLEQHIRELELLVKERKDWIAPGGLKEKDTIIINLNERINLLLGEKDSQASKLLKLEEQIAEFESQMAVCKQKGFLCKCKATPPPPPPPQPVVERWYYAVQDPQFASLFQMDPTYRGGDIIIDALEGATVVNPEYYGRSEAVPGMSRLRVRIVDFVVSGLYNGSWAGSELFVRLKLGEATQFTQARPFQYMGASWHQDMVFVEVPLSPSPSDPSVSISAHPLIIEVVQRSIGTVGETVVGSATIDLSNLIQGLTRTLSVVLNAGGSVNLRIKALDFGLLQPGVVAHQAQAVQQKSEIVFTEVVPAQVDTVTTTKRMVTTTTQVVQP